MSATVARVANLTFAFRGGAQGAARGRCVDASLHSITRTGAGTECRD